MSFVMVDDGENLQTCKIVSSKYKEKMKFLGRENRVEEIVNIFSVGVLCSLIHGEGISNAIMEYMALGKPVVASRCDGNKELVANGRTGYLISQGNAIELEERIIQFLDDSWKASQFGEAGRVRLVQKFNLENMTRKYMELYNEILKLDSKKCM